MRDLLRVGLDAGLLGLGASSSNSSRRMVADCPPRFDPDRDEYMALSDTFSQPITCAGYGFLMVAFGSIAITPSRLYSSAARHNSVAVQPRCSSVE